MADFSQLRMQQLLTNLARQYKLLNQYETARDLSRDPRDLERIAQDIITISASIEDYLNEYRQLGGDPSTVNQRADTTTLLERTHLPHNTQEGIMLKVVFLAASPVDASRLRVDQEARDIQHKLQLSRSRDNFNFQIRLAVRAPDLTQALLDIEPQIVHFSGHGSSQGALFIEDEYGQSHQIETETLASLFALVSDTVNCVLLNACYSEVQANAIVKHIPYVIGMSTAISDVAAIAFSVGFYQALGAGKSIEQSYDFGVIQIRLQGIPEHLTPILLKQA